jgi:hypothetical protein
MKIRKSHIFTYFTQFWSKLAIFDDLWGYQKRGQKGPKIGPFLKNPDFAKKGSLFPRIIRLLIGPKSRRPRSKKLRNLRRRSIKALFGGPSARRGWRQKTRFFRFALFWKGDFKRGSKKGPFLGLFGPNHQIWLNLTLF